MFAFVKKTHAFAALLGIFLFSNAPAHAQPHPPPSGYVGPEFHPQQIALGQSITLYNEPDCNPANGHPNVVFYASTTANTVGSSIGELGYGDNSTTWTPTSTGTYYICEYLTANGATCNVQPVPEFLKLVVTAN